MQAQKQRIGYGMTKAEAARIRAEQAPRASAPVGSPAAVNDGFFSGIKKLFG